jgi:hypothetical protein
MEAFWKQICVHLLRCIIDQDIQFPKRLHVAIDEAFAIVLLHQVARNKVDLRAFLLKRSLGAFGVLFLFREVRDGDAFAALTGEHDGGGAADPAVSSCDYCSLPIESIIDQTDIREQS